MSAKESSKDKSSNRNEWRPTKEFLRRIEEHARILRQKAKIDGVSRLDPWALAKDFGMKIVVLDELPGLSEKDRAKLCKVDPSVWSGMGIALPAGGFLIVLHPDQTPERANVTIMEEICHSYFNHSPSQLITQPNGIVKRGYDAQAEREAYWTAGATLLPSESVAKAVWRGEAAEELASVFGVSVELAEMRIRTLGLWREYKKAS